MTTKTGSIRYLGLARVMAGTSQEELEFSEEMTVGELVQTLIQRHGPNMEASLLTARGTLRGNVMVLVDGEDVAEKGGLEARLRPEADTAILITVAPVAGGCA